LRVAVEPLLEDVGEIDLSGIHWVSSVANPAPTGMAIATTDDEPARPMKAELVLKEFFLAQVADQAASEISYGQQKLLTLACCAAMDASLLLLDEPVAGISPEFRERIAERLDSFKVTGKTILLIEHQADFLEHTGDAFLVASLPQSESHPALPLPM